VLSWEWWRLAHWLKRITGKAYHLISEAKWHYSARTGNQGRRSMVFLAAVPGPTFQTAFWASVSGRPSPPELAVGTRHSAFQPRN
jgi:formylglycine-generating enzyme required for sulfatase activity